MNCTKHSQLVLTIVALLVSVCGTSVPVRAQFGGGAQIVFDPQMFGRQLQELQQQTATVANLALQLQYVIKNTTGGSAGIWQSNQALLNNLGNLIRQQKGLSYTVQGLGQQFRQLYPGSQVTSTPGAQSSDTVTQTTLNTLNGTLQAAQAQTQNLGAEQVTLQTLELRNQAAIGSLQAVQVSNELALAQVQQIQMLRQLTVAMINAQNVVAANQINAQVQSDLEAQAFFSAPASLGTPDVLNSNSPPPPQ